MVQVGKCLRAVCRTLYITTIAIFCRLLLDLVWVDRARGGPWVVAEDRMYKTISAWYARVGVMTSCRADAVRIVRKNGY